MYTEIRRMSVTGKLEGFEIGGYYVRNRFNVLDDNDMRLRDERNRCKK